MFAFVQYESYGIAAGGAATASSASASSTGGVGGAGHRLQDAELQKMSDQGKCLSLHQPYASLLVAGIKKCTSSTFSLSLSLSISLPSIKSGTIRLFSALQARRSHLVLVAPRKVSPGGCSTW